MAYNLLYFCYFSLFLKSTISPEVSSTTPDKIKYDNYLPMPNYAEIFSHSHFLESLTPDEANSTASATSTTTSTTSTTTTPTTVSSAQTIVNIVEMLLLAECRDDATNCKKFSEQCDTHQDVRDVCKETCGLCPPTTTSNNTTTTTTTTTTNQSGSCEDESSLCESLINYCPHHLEVQNSCRKTCGICTSTNETTKVSTTKQSDECKDETTLCKLFVNHCFMKSKVRESCKETCGICSKAPSQVSQESCEDFFEICKNMEVQCIVDKYTRSVCRKTCQVCTLTAPPIVSKCEVKVAHQNNFRDSCLRAHNNARFDNLEWSNNLQVAAQAWAEQLANSGEGIKYSTARAGDGENISVFDDSALVGDPSKACSEALMEWLGEGGKYHVDNPTYSVETARFTQTMWASSTQIGIGIASCPTLGRTYVVAWYNPRGNVAGEFEANVV